MKITPLQQAERDLEREYFAQCKRYAKPDNERRGRHAINEEQWARQIMTLTHKVNDLGGDNYACLVRARRKYDRLTGLVKEGPV